MTKRVPTKTPGPSIDPPARPPLFRFAEVERKAAPLGTHQAIHGAD